MKVEKEISIARPPTEVFAYVADVRNDPSWHTDVLEVRSSMDVVGMGTVFNVKVKVKPSMGVSEGTMKISRFDPGRSIDSSDRGGASDLPPAVACERESAPNRRTAR